jgi:hypothetical protein
MPPVIEAEPVEEKEEVTRPTLVDPPREEPQEDWVDRLF